MALAYNDDGSLYDDGNPLPVDPAPLAITVTKTPFEQAAERVTQSVKHRQPLPVDDDRFKAFGPANPERPSYVMEPDLLETQGGQHLPAGLMQADDGRLYYQDQPDLTVPVVRRPGLLPIARTPEGIKFAVPRLLDLLGNVMGNVAAPKIAAKAGEAVLGSGMVRTMNEGNEGLSYLLNPKVDIIGKETGKIKPDGISILKLENAPEGYDANRLVYSEAGKIIGAMQITKLPNSNVYKVANTYVDPAFRRQGIATKLNEEGSKLFGKLESSDLEASPAGQAFRESVLRSDTRNQVASAVGHALEKPNEMGFYSALERAVTHAKPNLATADQWLGYLRNQPGVKAEELQYVLNDLPQGVQISRDELKGLMNKVELKEKVLGEKLNNFDDNGYIANENNTQYHNWQLPGGEPGSYRELLLSLPERKTTNGWKIRKNSEVEGEFEVIDKNGKVKYGTTDETDALNYIHDQNYIDGKSDNLNYKAPHFDEHGTNLLAHARINERQLGEGYVVKNTKSGNTSQVFNTKAEAQKYFDALPEGMREGPLEIVGSSDKAIGTHIEELQSDWHQKGRKEGYKGEKEKLQPEFDKVEEKLMNSNDEKMLGLPKIEDVLKEAVAKKIINQQEAQTYKRYTDIENGQPVPDAPFKKNWDELLLKRVIHEAAKKNHDFISWTPGEAQALRYPDALRQQVNGINWAPRPKHLEKFHSDDLIEHLDLKNKEIKHVVVDGKTDRMWFNVDKEGNIVSASHSNVKGKKLDEIIGKQMSQQILEKEKGEINAKDFVMGAEGMKGFYDKMLVDKANALAKKYGSKVEQREIPTIKDYYNVPGYKGGDFKSQSIHYLPLTKELKEKALNEGFPLFSSSPTLTAVDYDPFERKKVKLVPVDHQPEFK